MGDSDFDIDIDIDIGLIEISQLLGHGRGLWWNRSYENGNATVDEPDRAGRCSITWRRRSQTRGICGGRGLLRQGAGDGRHCSNVRVGGLPIRLQDIID